MHTTFVALIQRDHSNFRNILRIFLEQSEPEDELVLTDCSADRSSNHKLRGYQLGPHNIRSVLHFAPVSEDIAIRTALRARKFKNVKILSPTDVPIYRDLGANLAKREQPKSAEIDLLFLPHNRYHTATSFALANRLLEMGISAGVLDVTHHIKDEGVTKEAQSIGLDLCNLDDIIEGRVSPRGLVVFNDWEIVSRTILAAAQSCGIMTIAIVEGIQDYDDVDTGRVRNAYKMCERVILPGNFDRRYFTKKQETVLGGIPRLHSLSERNLKNPPNENIAAINVNFTYDVLEHKRDDWLNQVVKSCLKAEFSPIITRHLADTGKGFRELESKKSAYDLIEGSSVLITRFSTLVLESLILNRPVIYFNPHVERVDKFLEPMGAYQIAESAEELEVALGRLRDVPLPPEGPKLAFLKEHAHTGLSGHETVPSILLDFVHSRKAHTHDFGAFRKVLQDIDIATRCYSNKLPLQRIPARFGG